MSEPTDKDISNSALYELLRPEIRKMAHQMEQKFRLHDKERGNPFDCDDIDFIRNRFKAETVEMHRAMERMIRPSEVWKEAADRCNFILMEAVAYEREYNKSKLE